MADQQKKRSFQDQGEQQLREEAYRMARATQTPGQTKEQTKLIAKGIEKGIALYKLQQKDKAHERDKARKKAQRLAQQARTEGPSSPTESACDAVDRQSARTPLIVAGLMLLLGGAAHLLRWLMDWELLIAGYALPVTASLPMAAVAALLALWLLRVASKVE